MEHVPLSANVTETAKLVANTVEGQLGIGHDAEDVGQEERGVSSARGDGVRGPGRVTLRRSGESHLPERPKRQVFRAEYKLRIVREADEALESGGEASVGALLRREGLYSSYLTAWRRERDEGELAGLTPRKRGRKSTKNPLADEVAKLQRELDRVKQELTRPTR